MENFGQRIKRLRAARGWTLSQLFAASGVQGQTVSLWEKGVDAANVRDSNIRAVARAFGVDPDYLRYGEAALLGSRVIATEESAPDAPGEVRVTVYELRASAGAGEVAPDFIETKEPHRFKRSWLNAKHLKADDLRVITVEGDSMEPLLMRGDRITVDISDTAPRSGHVYVVWYGGEVRVKRIFRERDGALRLESENTTYSPDRFTGEDLNGLKIYGRVRDRSGDGGL